MRTVDEIPGHVHFVVTDKGRVCGPYSCKGARRVAGTFHANTGRRYKIIRYRLAEKQVSTWPADTEDK